MGGRSVPATTIVALVPDALAQQHESKDNGWP